MTCLSRLTANLASIASWPARVAAARAAFRALAAMDARELADIGLTPADLRDATALPLAADPAVLLAERAVARRGGPQGGAARPAGGVDGFIGLVPGKSRKVATRDEIGETAARARARSA